MKQQDHQAERILIGFCVAAYFVSYITRINYGTVLLEIVNSEGITKMSASMAVTGSFVTYGIGQLISGWLGDRIKPRYLMFIGLMVSAGMNVCVPLFSRPAAMLVFWCINGFAQALMWPPMVRLLSDYLDQDTYKKSCVWVSWGSSAGTIFLYLFAPVCIVWKGWRSLFFLCAGCAVLFAFAWIKAIGSAEKRMQKGSARSFTEAAAGASRGDAGTENGTSLEENTSALQKTIPLPEKTAPMLAIIMLAIMMQGILRDGITTWMPSYISETFHLASFISILTGIALLLFGIVFTDRIPDQPEADPQRIALWDGDLCARFCRGVSVMADAKRQCRGVGFSVCADYRLHAWRQHDSGQYDSAVLQKVQPCRFYLRTGKLLHLCGQRNFQLWYCVDCG